ncbi:aminopeptidase Ey-like isoform X1 [Anoplolepis gracilipes]|uniref:aminopeptidase Ey-like isoform X1 n=2 Tax=Anoplolepis gracilipes TaxID=354296 RepID=UPI003B9E9A99
MLINIEWSVTQIFITIDNCYRYLKIDMAFLKLLFYGELIFIITAISLSVDENTDKSAIHFNNYSYIVPANYSIKLELYSKNYINLDNTYKKYKIEIDLLLTNSSFVLHGDLHVDIAIFHPTFKISFNSSRSIVYLFVKLISKTLLTQEYLGVNLDCDPVTEICVLDLNKELSSGNYTLHVHYLNAINYTENNLISLESVHTNSSGILAWSSGEHFQAIGARRLFPCWDESTIKTTFNISIQHHHNYSVFSNMPKEKRITKSHMKWTFFKITPEMPTYLVTVVISSGTLVYDKYETDKVIVWHRPELQQEMKFALMVANKTMTLFEWKWKKLNILTVQFVAIYGLPYNNQSWGLVLNREIDIIYDENLHSVAHKIEVELLIARETIHQWFYNLINPFYSSYLWLINGLTTFFGMYAVNFMENYVNSEMMDLFVVQFQYESFRLDDYSFHQSFLTEINPFKINALSSFSRYKAPLILRTVQCLITDEVFGKSIYRYINNHMLNSMDPDDFLTVMEITLFDYFISYPEFVRKDTFSLRRIFDGFTNSTNYPVLNVARDYFENSVNITIKNYDILKYNDFLLPVTYTTQNDLNFENLKFPFEDDRFILISSTKPIKQIFVKDDGWVMFNLQQAGYYRVNYDDINWQTIAEYLNSAEYTKVHVLNRAKIIDDAFHFMITRQLNSSIFWNLSRYLTRETNYIAWYPMIKALEYMSKIFPFQDKRVQNVKDKIKEELSNLLWEIKYSEEEYSKENDLTKCLRQEAIKWACVLNDVQCRETANIKLMKYITKQETNNLLPWWKQWTFCKGLMTASLQFWSMVKNNLEGHFVEPYNRVAEFLACTSNEIMDKYWEDEYLELIRLEHNKTYNQIHIKSYINSFLFIIANHAKHNMLSKILTNINKSKPSDVSIMSIFIIIVNNIYSEKQLHEITTTLKPILLAEACIIMIKNNVDHLCKDNINLFDSVFAKEIVPNFYQKWTSYVDQKIQLRLSQIREIETQIRIFGI